MLGVREVTGAGRWLATMRDGERARGRVDRMTARPLLYCGRVNRMAGTVTVSEQKFLGTADRPIRKYVFSWTSDASGDVSGTVSTYFISGTIVKAVFVPGSGGVAPTANYDVTLLDEQGADVLGGQGANRSATLPEAAAPGVLLCDGTVVGVAPMQVDNQLELRVANAGSAKQGSLRLYVR